MLTPTRELAIQVAEAMQTYARHLEGFHVVPIYGGQSMEGQLRQFARGVHVVVGTPGRIQDHLRRKSLKLDRLSSIVIDEADEMLRMGFIDDVKGILDEAPPTRQIALFSATMPSAIRKVVSEYLRDPVVVKIKSATATVATVTQRFWEVAGVHKLTALTRILEVEEFDAMLVFVRTRNATVELAEKLEARGFASAALSGDLSQSLRERTVERLKSGALDIVVATDVAARGLHVERISHVINYDVPYDTEAYVHRVGRTARAGRAGQAILFVSPRERPMLRAIERATGHPIAPMRLPTSEDIVNRRVAKFKQAISEAIDSQDLTPFDSVVAEYQREHDADPAKVAAALAYLAQKDRPLRPARAEEPAPPPAAPTPAPTRAAAKTGVARRRYRIEVGREHKVEPKNIVGAIANETGIPSRSIGSIEIHRTYSTVELPDGMPQKVLAKLRKVRVGGRPLRIDIQR
jgi:ATP-dependent RNA helicase DeaD